MDDIKISHIDSKVNNKIIDWLKEKYEDKEIGVMSPKRGKIHEFIGMKLDFRTDGEVSVDMCESIEQIVANMIKYIKGLAKVESPAAPHLFKVRKEVEKIPIVLAKKFHNIVARGLFVCKRARANIHTAIAFLTTRMAEPDRDDWKKLLQNW